MTQNYNDILPADSLSSSLDKIEGRDDSVRDLFAGTAEPSSPVAYQLWADTTTTKLKQRNAANNAWIIIGDLVATDMGHLRTDGTNTMSASLNFNSNKGINCTDPTLDQDVSTKKYVDDNITAAGSAKFDASVDTTAGSSSGLVTPSGSAYPTIAWAATINNGFVIGSGIDQSAITVSASGTYLINAMVGFQHTGAGEATIAVRVAAGSSGSLVSAAQISLVPLQEGSSLISILITFSASDTFDIIVNAPAGFFNNNATHTKMNIIRVS